MSTIAEIREFDKLAKFGSEDIYNDFMTSELIKKEVRVKALHKLHYSIVQLLRFSKATIENKVKKEERPKIKEYELMLLRIEKLIPSCFKKIKDNQRRMTMRIDESKFDKVHSLLMNLYDDVFKLVYKAELIFPVSDEFDPDELIKKMSEDIIMSG